MNINSVFLKLLSAMLFAVLVTSFSSAMINGVSGLGLTGEKGSGGGLDIGNNIGGGALGSNNYLIIAIVGIIIVVAVLLVVKVVIPKLREK